MAFSVSPFSGQDALDWCLRDNALRENSKVVVRSALSQGKSSPISPLVTSSLPLRRGIPAKVRNNFVTRWGSISCFFQGIKIRTTATGYNCKLMNINNAVVGARAEPLLHHGPLQQVLGVSTQFAVFPDLAGAHLSIGVNAFALRTKAHQLRISGADHPRTDVRGTFRRNPAPQLPIIHRRYVNVDVNAIQQRARNL